MTDKGVCPVCDKEFKAVRSHFYQQHIQRGDYDSMEEFPGVEEPQTDKEKHEEKNSENDEENDDPLIVNPREEIMSENENVNEGGNDSENEECPSCGSEDYWPAQQVLNQTAVENEKERKALKNNERVCVNCNEVY